MTLWRALLAAWLAMLATAATAQTFPKFSGLVVDDANVLSPATEADLTAKLQALQQATKRQFVVATIADVQGYPLEEYGYRLGRAWGVGLKDVDNGAILFIAPNNPQGQRGPRLEVGRGLEPILTDALASMIINQAMMPRLRAGDIDGAMTAGADQVVQQLRAAPEEQQARVDAAAAEFDRRNRRSGNEDFNPAALLIPAVIIIFFVLPAILGRGGRGRRYRRSGAGSVAGAVGEVILWTAINAAMNGRDGDGDGGGFFGGGGGSSGGWGGGGFSGGGGGSFGGGGASGSW